MNKRLRETKGFTLVELSIALVVIGLLIGSVLVAMNIIQNARATSAVNAIQSVQAAVSTYSQNFNALPGDDSNAKARFTSIAVPENGGGDSKIGDGNSYNTTSTAAGNGDGESALVWSHLRAAGLVKGDGTDTAQPGNPFGGKIGIQNGAFVANGIVGTNVVCADNIPGASARVIDQRMDDGNALTGIMRASTAIDADAAAYADNATYIICTGL